MHTCLKSDFVQTLYQFLISCLVFVFQMNNQINRNKPSFTDSVDRLFIVSELFDLEALFSDLTLENTQGIVGVIDKSSNDKLLHFVTNEKRLKVIWRTVVQQVNMDPLASGFRALVYHSGKIFSVCS